MKYRRLRIAFSVVCGILCLLLIVLWVRSHGAEDRLTGNFAGSHWFRVYSSHGCLVYYVPGTPGPPSMYAWQPNFGSEFWLEASDGRIASVPRVRLHREEDWVTLPYWFLVGLCAVVAATPWLRWRFSVRTLLIAITILALALGNLIATTR
jgi:hypothetical protein